MAVTYTLQSRQVMRGVLDNGSGDLNDIIAGSLFPDLSFVRTNTAGQTWQQALVTGTLAAGIGQTFSLNDPANTLLCQGLPVEIANLCFCAVGIVGPDGTKAVRFGPQNVAAPAPLWFGGTGATVYETVYGWLLHQTPGAWSVSAAAANVRVFNPGAGSVSFVVWAAGYK